MVEQLKGEYANQQVLFIEDNVDTPVGGRYSYWWAANGGGTVSLPLTMLDSGHAFTSGYSSATTYQSYKNMLDAELARPPQARFDNLGSSRVGNHLHFTGRMTNLMATALPASAKIQVIVYEEHTPVSGEHITRHILRTGLAQSIGSSLASGASFSFSLDSADLTNVVDWANVYAVVVVDYRPGGTTGAYDMLQAARIYPRHTLYLPFTHR